MCETNSTQLTFSVLCISRSYCKFYCFDIFKLFTFQGVPNSGKEEKGTWDHVWGVWGLTHCGMFFMVTTAAQLGSSVPVHCHLESSMCQTTILLVVNS